MEDASGRASNADPRGDSLSGDDFDDRPTIGQQEPTRLPPSTTIQAKKRARVEHIVSNIRVPTYTENAGRSVVLSPRSFDRMVEPEVGKEDHGLGQTRGDGERRSKRKQVLPQQHDTGDDRRSVDEDLSDDDDDDDDRFRTASSREQPDDYDDQVLQQQLRIVQCRLEDMYAKYAKSLHANDPSFSALHTPHDNINPSSDSKMCSETERLTSLFKV